MVSGPRLLYLPYMGMMPAVVGWPGSIQTVLGPADADLEACTTQAEHFLKERPDSDMLMFGFYIYNNIGIFRTFAGGIVGGLGSVFF